jgi:hypothetical protein
MTTWEIPSLLNNVCSPHNDDDDDDDDDDNDDDDDDDDDDDTDWHPTHTNATYLDNLNHWYHLQRSNFGKCTRIVML